MKYLRLMESVTLDLGPNADEIREKTLRVIESKNHIITPKIEAIHSIITRNEVFYPAPKLKGKIDFAEKVSGKIRPTGVYSWTMPYKKPMLKNHDITSEPLGRIVKAEFKNKTSIGVPGIICTPEITDPEAIEKILDGRYSTVSIGADTDSAVCSICGTNVLEEWCEHTRGRVYEGKKCFWTAGNLWFVELSFVNNPADENANTIEVPDTTESVDESKSYVQLGILLQDLKENKVYDLTNDKVYVPTDNGLVEIPPSEFMKEYYYIPFNIRLNESAGSETKEAKAGEDPNRPKGKDGKPIGKMKTGNQKQAYYGWAA